MPELQKHSLSAEKKGNAQCEMSQLFSSLRRPNIGPDCSSRSFAGVFLCADAMCFFAVHILIMIRNTDHETEKQGGFKMKNPFREGGFRLTGTYGSRTDPISGQTGSFHSGIDLVGIKTKDIVSLESGQVVRSRIVTDQTNPTWEWGNYVAVLGVDGYTVYYCHMAERKVNQGDFVKAGDIIGTQGSTGYSTGPHLHVEVRKNDQTINAADYLGIKNQEGIYAQETTVSAPPVPLTYTVKKGESLYSIAQKYNISTDTLVRINGRESNNNIETGWHLILTETPEAAIEKLSLDGILNDKNFWLTNYSKYKNVGHLLLAGAKLHRKGPRTQTPEQGIENLSRMGIIREPQFWLKNYPSYPNVGNLLKALGGCTPE